MPGKARAQIPAPIDRPLSRAYLRQFTGWSTAYPPGMSDPTSLREMENVQVNRDGSLRVRPGLRHMSYERQGDGTLLAMPQQLVGTHEPFFLDDGTKAYLIAVRESTGNVGFRVLARLQGKLTVYNLDDEGINFSIPNGKASLEFGPTTTYVKYLQIDNKVFALSNAGEYMRLFQVGENKSAKALSSITRPDWNNDDKLTVVQPTKAWIDGSLPSYTRYNRFPSPTMTGLDGWSPSDFTRMVKTDDQSQDGPWSMGVTSKPTRTNLMPRTLDSSGTVTAAGWSAEGNVNNLTIVGNAVQANMPSGADGRKGYVSSPMMDADPQVSYQAAIDVVADSGLTDGGFLIRFYNTGGAQIGAGITREFAMSPGRKVGNNVLSPKGTASMRLYVWGQAREKAAESFSFRNVLVSPNEEATTFFNGGTGANYFWLGTSGNSASVYHPPQTLTVSARIASLEVKNWCASIYARGQVARSVQLNIAWKGGSSGDTDLGTTSGTAANDATGAWTRYVTTAMAPTGTTRAIANVKIVNVPRGEWHYLDSALFESGSVVDVFFSGATTDTDTRKNSWEGTPQNSTSVQVVWLATGPVPPPATPTTKTLISSNKDRNMYSFAFFYTFSNEIGESAASQITVVKAQRGWNSWTWELPNAAAEPNGTGTNDPGKCADQLVAYLPLSAFQAAVDQGAVWWNLYMFTWSDQDPVPVMALRIDEQKIDPVSHTYVANCWLRATPETTDTGDEPMTVPTAANRYNYTRPGRPAQGLVAADRMVVVADPSQQAVIRWTSNQQGSYTDFSAVRGGGYKTLTSGNLFIPACVKLWQNPQSVDTLTILCLGVDGMSTGYYMQPAQVASQTEATNIMGFEETTATPGTVSPYGCEVLNNALFHPLDEMLVKSTANNYNISHKSATDQIQNVWRALGAKQRIVSSQLENRLYYLVYNPDGPDLADGWMGNEVWVYDTGLGSDKGTWSRWLTGGCSLRKIESGNRVFMSLSRPEGLFYFDDYYGLDDVVNADRTIGQAAIPWKVVTNTQGANRSHDAWAHLQQLGVWFGNFQGKLRYGVRGLDRNGKWVDKSKTVTDNNAPDDLPFDLEDFLSVERDMRDWQFYAGSVTDDAGVTLPSYGQLSLVQYRYTPVTVNVGYSYGSVETFEYGRADAGDQSISTNGTPVPYIDTRRP